jgi:ABC-type sugar transport system ATPase subunit
MAAIHLEDITVVFRRPWDEQSSADDTGPVTALDRVNLTIPDGRTVAIIGPSGCGKTTLLRVAAGLEKEFSGRVFYDDKDMADIPVGDRYIGMVFQNYALYPHFEGRGNLSFFFRMHRASDEEMRERIRITSETMGVGFKELLQCKPGTLSGGQQQRLAVARAIVRRPNLFLFDEPLSNLDAKLRVRTRGEINRLLHQFQITAIYVTHDQIEAIALGDLVAVMREGRIEQIGQYAEIRENPVNAFVAEFLGPEPMNLFAGGVVADGQLRFAEMTVALPDVVRDQVDSGQSLLLGVHPESAVQVSAGRPLADGIHLRGVVEIVEPDFGRRSQTIRVRTGESIYAATGPLDLTLDIGAEVDVVFPDDQLYFFDGNSELRIG